MTATQTFIQGRKFRPFNQTVYGVLRRSAKNDVEHLDTESVDLTPGAAKRHADGMDRQHPGVAQAYPQTAVVELRIRVVRVVPESEVHG